MLDAIAADPELVQFLGTGKAGSIEIIRQGIESHLFQYGTRNFNFRHIYARHLKPWLADRLRLAFKEVEEWRDAAQSFVAWGGGVEMPGIASMLQREGITQYQRDVGPMQLDCNAWHLAECSEGNNYG
ncbi:hypothetical protein GTQ43_37115 [Nostoc sp. KVJ3]|uniref:hypothetical protein n=1 Tax=Nostoc sp. KVJ3 TaxID=457945 RepID=UPI002238EAD5|nr:hypothetical protein [Nostoc sp. KVJ3]MCW5319052.1 hypothetical protein [Nostoc sp. KVJ3]